MKSLFHAGAAYAILFAVTQPILSQDSANLYTQNSDGDVIDANTDRMNAPGPLPWFSDPAIREELHLNDEAFSQLYRNYEVNWSNYNQRLQQLGNNLAPQQREEQIEKISGDFQRRFDEGVASILIDPAERLRFNQVYTQYRGFGAFNDPIIQQKLNLTGEQRELFSQYDGDWKWQLIQWADRAARNPRLAASVINASRTEMQFAIESTLTSEQNRIWIGLVGQPFDFPPDVYFPGDSSATPAPVAVVDGNGWAADLSDR